MSTPFFTLRKQLMKTSRVQLELERMGPDLIARCGCTFVPWHRKIGIKGEFIRGVGLIHECDMSNRIAEHSMSGWETHTFFAREDAENLLEDIVRLLSQNPNAMKGIRNVRHQ